MEDIYIGTPNAKQDEFLRCKKKYVAFGGARGGWQSWRSGDIGWQKSGTGGRTAPGF